MRLTSSRSEANVSSQSANDNDALVRFRQGLRGMSYDEQMRAVQPPMPVQLGAAAPVQMAPQKGSAQPHDADKVAKRCRSSLSLFLLDVDDAVADAGKLIEEGRVDFVGELAALVCDDTGLIDSASLKNADVGGLRNEADRFRENLIADVAGAQSDAISAYLTVEKTVDTKLKAGDSKEALAEVDKLADILDKLLDVDFTIDEAWGALFRRLAKVENLAVQLTKESQGRGELESLLGGKVDIAAGGLNLAMQTLLALDPITALTLSCGLNYAKETLKDIDKHGGLEAAIAGRAVLDGGAVLISWDRLKVAFGKAVVASMTGPVLPILTIFEGVREEFRQSLRPK